MKYYAFPAEHPDLYETGTCYIEVDWTSDMVVRSVEVFPSGCLWGQWTGTVLEGHICDHNASELQLTETEEISSEKFETQWKVRQRH